MSEVETDCECTRGYLPDEQGVKADPDRSFTLGTVKGTTYWGLTEHSPHVPSPKDSGGKKKANKPRQ